MVTYTRNISTEQLEFKQKHSITCCAFIPIPSQFFLSLNQLDVAKLFCTIIHSLVVVLWCVCFCVFLYGDHPLFQHSGYHIRFSYYLVSQLVCIQYFVLSVFKVLKILSCFIFWSPKKIKEKQIQTTNCNFIPYRSLCGLLIRV